jgi:DNA-binding PucR family transcriptional regulator
MTFGDVATDAVSGVRAYPGKIPAHDMTSDYEAPKSSIMLPSIRALAAKWAAERQQSIADEMSDYIIANIAPIREDAKLSELARGTCLAMVELLLTMMEHAIPGDRAETPVVAVEYARLIAERGLSLEDLLRSYRLGHACFARIWADAIMELDEDPADLVRAVWANERFLFALIDVVSSKIGAVYLAERQRLHRRAASKRRDMVRALLDGDDVDVTRAEQSLGHSLTGPQLAFICWSDSDSACDPAMLQQAATALQEALAAPKPLLLPPDDHAISGWFNLSGSTRRLIKTLTQAVGTAAPEVHVALGPVLPGLSGFRRSRAGAERVTRVIGLTARQPPTLTEWRNIALVDALSVDLEAARELVRCELRALNRGGEHTQVLRDTAQAFVVSGFSYTAVASRLHIHRNTVLHRVKKAEALRGRPLTERPAELLAALALIDTIGSEVLDR